MKIKVCVGCDVASYANVEMEAPEFNLEHIKRKMSALVDNGDLQFEAEDPNGTDYQSGHRIVYAKNTETDEYLCDFVPLNPAYYELGQDTMHTLRQHLEGKIDANSLVEELVRLAKEHNTYPADLQNKAINRAIEKTEAQSPKWAF